MNVLHSIWHNNYLMSTIHKTAIAAPTTPGVYLFRRGRTLIYVGKAANIKKRVTSYFRKNGSEKERHLTAEATTLEFLETPSEIEALILEAELIRRHLPKFNVIQPDYLYVGVTDEEFPKFFFTRQPAREMPNAKCQMQNKKVRSSAVIQHSAFSIQHYPLIGPFTSAYAIRSVVRMVRRVFPYCTCGTPHKRLCLNAQIGRCLGFCCLDPRRGHVPTDEERTRYRENIKNIIAILTGKKHELLRELKRELRTAVAVEKFEEAARLRDALFGVENVFRHRPAIRQNVRTRRNSAVEWSAIQPVIQALFKTNSPIRRVEGYDISNISGTDATGSMVVFIDGTPAKKEYRKFKIKTVHQANDVAMHKEVMRRRLNHISDWGTPDLLVIDGGRPQLGAVRSILRRENPRIHLSALAKRDEELYLQGKVLPVRLATLPPAVMFFFQRVRDESHRFAKKYHHKLREMSYRP
ncbi:MAG: GIY-YIG nuclease family protein [bacterium]|nr:GIY-YIG nuclease family protein [bacterium]